MNNETNLFRGYCDYCGDFNDKLSEYYSDDFGGLELCPDCIELAEDGELQTCNLCDRLATRDGHSYCDDCY